MAVAKEQIRQIISQNNINSVSDVYSLLKESFKDILQELNLATDILKYFSLSSTPNHLRLFSFATSK